MQINHVAALTGLNAKTIRFYEQKGLIDAPVRSANGYRQYSNAHIAQLQFLKRTREAGFNLHEAKELLLLWLDPQRKSCEVKAKTQEKIELIDAQIAKLQEVKYQLQQLVDICPDDEHSNCPIIDSFSKKTAL
ncbi:Cu(I)-responsive transcriptional regulator [Pasteurellaceae bacterium HPA106]|uniref:Cu(I)-responsive transcriptional regulator n=1 Tax=Spirabiliibacterium pneumoniae TaxID=221400 RepID=UPI001AAC64CA|nr:Cu(I)-responsive transcriptional regulator [Spirabiliibacterium pneumoniae]MBE2896196.1 Cu(I)-responsive transcriptional regulator [Spirabiliibacterium pneumoniae]